MENNKNYKNDNYREYKVYRIYNGTVIDHIPAGLGLKVIEILKPDNKNFAAVGLNLDSKKFKKKDLVKFEGRFLSKKETDILSLLSSQVTINIIKEGKVIEKRKIERPEIIKGLVKCPNPSCITNFEKVETHFIRIKDNIYKCKYCEREFVISID